MEAAIELSSVIRLTSEGSLVWAAGKILTATWREHRFRFEASLNYGIGPVFCF